MPHGLIDIPDRAGGAASVPHFHGYTSTHTQQVANNLFDHRRLSPALPHLLRLPLHILRVMFL